MAESGAQERTEKPTAKRLREARKQGQVPRSRELSTAVIMGAGVSLVISLGPGVAKGAAKLMKSGLSFDVSALERPSELPAQFGAAAGQAFWLIAPILAATFFAAIVAPMLIGGWNFSAQALKPDFSRMNPISGIGRMFSANALVELTKSLAKFGLVGLVAGLAWWSARHELLGLGVEPGAMGIAHGLALVMHSLLLMTLALAGIAAVDVPWQLFSYMKKMKMSRQEIRDEYKQSEGRPEVKGRIRRMQQELSQRRMMEKLPGADVIVTNPTHYAVALQYAAGKMRAPKVIAKGVDEVALLIRAKGAEHRIPVLEAPPLARALYRGCQLEQEIPAQLYAAVAQVLTYVYQLKAWNTGEAKQRPDLPQVGEVPGGELDPPPLPAP